MDPNSGLSQAAPSQPCRFNTTLEYSLFEDHPEGENHGSNDG